MPLGWIYWNDDGIFKAQTKFEEWIADPSEDRLLGKLIFNAQGPPREIQQADWYYVAPHGSSGLYTHGTCHDGKKEETERRYPGAVFKRGIWAPTELWWELNQFALSFKAWDEIDWQQVSYKQIQQQTQVR